MNNLKLFDKAQLLIAIITVSCFLISIILYFPMSFTSQIVTDAQGVRTIVYNTALQGVYSFFTFAHILGTVWFVARLITFKLRRKEADLINN